MDVRLRSLHSRILLIYRPPDNASCNLLLEKFTRLLEKTIAESPGCLLITGDFNFRNNTNASHFMDILDSFDLKQHVSLVTHINGHTLDLLITKSNDTIIRSHQVIDPGLSDHYAVTCHLSLQKPQYRKKKRLFQENYVQWIWILFEMISLIHLW